MKIRGIAAFCAAVCFPLLAPAHARSTHVLNACEALLPCTIVARFADRALNELGKPFSPRVRVRIFGLYTEFVDGETIAKAVSRSVAPWKDIPPAKQQRIKDAAGWYVVDQLAFGKFGKHLRASKQDLRITEAVLSDSSAVVKSTLTNNERTLSVKWRLWRTREGYKIKDVCIEGTFCLLGTHVQALRELRSTSVYKDVQYTKIKSKNPIDALIFLLEKLAHGDVRLNTRMPEGIR